MAGYIGTQAVSVNTTSATISDDLAVGDDATITGDLDVDGTTNLDVVDIDGAVNMATTALVTGVLTTTAKAVSNGGIGMPDNAKLTFGGTGTGDLQIFHNGTDSVIQEVVTTRRLLIAGDQIAVRTADLSEDMAKFNVNGAAELYHNNAKKIETTSTGVAITGNLVIVTAGKGIDFSAQTASGATGVSSSKGELLDHYEQGAFTPIFQNSGGEQINYAFAAGFYVRVGARVHAHGYIGGGGNAGNTGTSNDLQLGGLPFDAVNVTNGHASVNFGYGANLNIAAGVNVTGYLGPNTTLITVQKWSSAIGTAALTFGELSTDGRLMFSLSYNAV